MDDLPWRSGWSTPLFPIFPDHQPGQAVHTIGIGVEGCFTASDVARNYCVAEHFGGEPVKVSVRFSTDRQPEAA